MLRVLQGLLIAVWTVVSASCAARPVNSGSAHPISRATSPWSASACSRLSDDVTACKLRTHLATRAACDLSV